jgi:predicted DCC family thiol-disulfide oxidoreductase YuxK
MKDTKYSVIYDGNCHLCTTLVQLLEQLDQGVRFYYIPMQDTAVLQQFQVTPEDCELGMLLINEANPDQRWQCSAAAEEIGRLLPLGQLFVKAYRTLPGLKPGGDRLYAFVRDHRYALFGQRSETYVSQYGGCESGRCQLPTSPPPLT